MARDTIYTDAIHAEGFSFDDTVVQVFADMIQRSVPGYGQTLQMVELLAHQYAQPDTNLYDLGCSLGAATMALDRGSHGRNCQIYAIDNAPAMIERCREQLNGEHIHLACEDILDTAIDNASVVVLNFVLQFVPLAARQPLLQKIYNRLNPGGALIISEKIRFDDAATDALQTTLHEAFKRAQGYSEMEISRKRSALENVLIPESEAIHHARLRAAGFATPVTWFQCFNFISMVAVK